MCEQLAAPLLGPAELSYGKGIFYRRFSNFTKGQFDLQRNGRVKGLSRLLNFEVNMNQDTNLANQMFFSFSFYNIQIYIETRKGCCSDSAAALDLNQ